MSRATALAVLRFAGSGMVLGCSGLHPSLWPLAWAGFAALAWALVACDSRRVAVLGLLVGLILAHAIFYEWSAGMFGVFFTGRLRIAVLTAGFLVLQTLPPWLCFSTGVTLLPRRWPVLAWMPVAWLGGEFVAGQLTHIPTAWLFTQSSVAPVLRMLARLGYVPTTLACLVAAAGIGEALGRKRARFALPAVPVAIGLFLAPAIPPGDLGLLERAAAVHMTSELSPPPVPDGAELIVWPETAFAERPPVSEGPVSRERFAAPLGGRGATHLAGVITLLPQARQNSAIVISPDGAITEARAKRVLFPLTETPLFGFGDRAFQAGRAAPLVEMNGHKVIPLLCFEYMTRELVADGKRAGGELIAVLAGDAYQAGSELVERQVLSLLVLRAVEFRLPLVYASRGGRAALIAPDGRVVASSARGRSGVLRWDARHGARDQIVAPAPTIAVLYSRAASSLRTDCLPGTCAYYAVDEVRGPVAPARTVIIAGHAAPPRYLDHDAEAVAAAAASFHPDLVVVDTCFGASTPLLSALAKRLTATVVAPPSFVDQRGLRYAPSFFTAASIDDRVAAVRADRDAPLLRWRLDGPSLAKAEERVAAMERDDARSHVRSWVPTLVATELAPGQEVLVPADWRSLGHPPAR